jgi:hypothetical protein
LEVYKYDENGRYVEPVEIEINEDGTYILPENCTDKPLPQPNYYPVYDHELGDWMETITEQELVARLSPSKIEELNAKCEETILGRFSVDLDGIIFEFSYDNQAQSRLNGTASLFSSDLITEIPWTAYLNDERQRIVLYKESFNKVAVAALTHCNDNIVKFNELLVQANNAQTLVELNQIVWDEYVPTI